MALFGTTGDYVHWRRRDFNQQADHIANVTLDTQKGQFYCDKEALREAKARSANISIFSDGGYRSSIPCSVGAFLVLAVYNDQTCFLAGQGFILDGYTGSFPAETVALETAVSFLVDWLHPSG